MVEMICSNLSKDSHLASPPLPVIKSQPENQQQGYDETDEADNVDYHLEAARLASYRDWPLSFMEPAKLAAAGFYFTGKDDKVKCFECQVEIFHWTRGDNPMSDHQRCSGRCRFVRKIPCGNVPIGADPATVPQPRPRSRDVCGPYGVEVRPGAEENSSLLPSSTTLGSLGLSRAKGPAHPQFASRDARYRSFESWPKSLPQKPDQLADAGFYYTGKSDQTLCYHCGGGLKDWEQDDEPWEQHAKWFSKCCYLLTVKGQDYVNSVTGQQVKPLTKEETHEMQLPSCIKKVETPAAPGDDAGPSKASESGLSSTKSQSCDEEVQQKPESKNLPSGGSSSSNNSSKSSDDSTMCKICYSGELGVVFLPCGHMVACVKCAPGMTTCAVCREPVTMTVRAFLS